MNGTVTAACICIVILYGLDYALFSGTYLNALMGMISDLYFHLR